MYYKKSSPSGLNSRIRDVCSPNLRIWSILDEKKNFAERHSDRQTLSRKHAKTAPLKQQFRYPSFSSFRDRDRDKRRDKYSTSSSKSHSNSNTEGGVLSSVLNSDRDIKIDKDKEQAKLEDEMQKRRERIEQWRAEKVSFIYYLSTFIAQNLI